MFFLPKCSSKTQSPAIFAGTKDLGIMTVLKFGGTSVGDSQSMKQALAITGGYIAEGALLVSSAMSGVTNSMVALASCIRNHQPNEAQELVDDLESQHFRTMEELLDREPNPEDQAKLGHYFGELRALVKGSLLLKECSERVYDALLSTGELLSTTILHLKAQEMGWDASWHDSRKLIKTDSQYGNAGIDWESTAELILQQDLLSPRKLSIVQGFIGSDANDVTTTLGRGGSDYSASIFGSVLGAKEVQIWTDVDGILTTDPRIVSTARTIPEISYSEAAELAYFGAKVVHPSTIQPAVEKNIPVYVKNTKKSPAPRNENSRPGPRKGPTSHSREKTDNPDHRGKQPNAECLRLPFKNILNF
jgi:aspartate kinase